MAIAASSFATSNLDLEGMIDKFYIGKSYKGTAFEGDHIDPLITFNSFMFKYFNPDINGYYMVFFVPPPFKNIIDRTDVQYVELIKKLTIFAANDFTPPERSVESETVSSRSGGVPYATEMTPSNQCSVTFIDNHDLDIYNFHCNWVDYIHDLLEGYIEPHGDYLDYNNSKSYGLLDYAGSFFFVKFDPDVRTIKYVGKATGVYPDRLPSNELIGQRSSNEITTLPFTYRCAWYDETFQKHHPIWEDLEQNVLPIFKGS